MAKQEWTVNLHTAVADMIMMLPSESVQLVQQAIAGLLQEPLPPNSRTVPGLTDGYEIIAGNFRIIYKIQEAEQEVSVIVLTLSF